MASPRKWSKSYLKIILSRLFRRYLLLLIFCSLPVVSLAANLDVYPLFLGGDEGRIYQYPAVGGDSADTLTTGVPSHGVLDICFSGDVERSYMFAVNANGIVSRFASTGQHLPLANVTGSGSDISCVADASGHIYVGSNETRNIRKIKTSASGEVADSYSPDTTADASQAALWAMDLAKDKCTLFYTDHNKIRRYNVCTDNQLSDLATHLTPEEGGGSCWGLKILGNGQVLASCVNAVFLLSPTGSVLRTYAAGIYRFDPGDDPGSFGRIALARDEESFWVTKVASPGSLRRAYQIHLSNGELMRSFDTPEISTSRAVAMYPKARCITIGGVCLPLITWAEGTPWATIVIIMVAIGVLVRFSWRRWWRRPNSGPD